MENKASVQIILTTNGVYRVRLCGKSWDDEEEASQIYQKVSHLVKEMDRILKRVM